ncbi:MAG: PAS domain S-box protein [Yoonia sp.]
MFEPTKRESRLEAVTIRIAMLLAFILTFLGLILVGYHYDEIRNTADKVRNAGSDNVTWTIVQTEVDFQNLQLALSGALISMLNGESAVIDEIKRAFDIYYSRTNAVQFVYGLAASTANDDPSVILDRLNQRKFELAEILDGWDRPSITEIRDLLELVDQSEDDVRSFTTQMLKVLVADTSDTRLKQLSMLSRFAVLLGVVVGLLLSMLGVSVLLLTRLQNKAITTSSIADNLRHIVEASQDAVVIADQNGTVVQYNQSAHEIFGYTAQEAIGASMEDLFIPEDQKAAHQLGMARYSRTGQARVVNQGRKLMTARNKSGLEFPVEVTISESKDRLRRTIFIGILRDVSARIAKDIELNMALEEAKKDASAKERFLAVMSHEMRTPLQGVLATFDLLNHQAASGSEKSLIKLGEQSAVKALEQINQTLEIVRLNEVTMSKQADIIDPLASLQNLITLLEPLLHQRRNTITLEFSTESNLQIIGNQYLFDALFDNLLSNANKFTEAGHISIHLQANALSCDKVELLIEVADTGVGIAAEDLTSIFDDFITSDDTYTRSFEGTGLGLGIVKRCCERMGGEISVESKIGVGAIFRFRCVCGIVAGHVSDTSSNQILNDNKEEVETWERPPLILIVDDNKINQTMIGKMLEKLGCGFEYADDGLVAVQKCACQSYDLILMDLSMPNLNGLDATPLIRQICRPQGAIVCISAHSSDELCNSVREAGMSELLPKPVRLDELASLLKRTVIFKTDEALCVMEDSLGVEKNTDIEVQDLLETFGTDQFFTFIKDFDQTLTSDIKQVKLLLNYGKHKDAAGLLHRSAGSAGMIGAKRLSLLLMFLEDRANSERLNSGEPLLETCIELLESFLAHVHEFRRSTSDVTGLLIS